ncbi:MAG: GNAT family N-acetyltransferase [Caldilineaceae bacterium]
MIETELAFRSAQPTDATVTAPLIYSAAPDQYRFVFAVDRYTIVDFLQRAFHNGSRLFGYQRYTVATLQDQAIAIGAFYGAADHPRPDLKTIATLINCFDPIRFVGILRRSAQFSALLSHAVPETKYIANFAVAEAWRSQGIGTSFLQREIGLAKTQGYKNCALNVSSSNPKAQQLYERLGFQVVQEYSFTQIATQVRPPALRRMELTL